jgi:hypothetical protein
MTDQRTMWMNLNCRMCFCVIGSHFDTHSDTWTSQTHLRRIGVNSVSAVCRPCLFPASVGGAPSREDVLIGAFTRPTSGALRLKLTWSSIVTPVRRAIGMTRDRHSG